MFYLQNESNIKKVPTSFRLEVTAALCGTRFQWYILKNLLKSVYRPTNRKGFLQVVGYTL